MVPLDGARDERIGDGDFVERAIGDGDFVDRLIGAGERDNFCGATVGISGIVGERGAVGFEGAGIGAEIGTGAIVTLETGASGHTAFNGSTNSV